MAAAKELLRAVGLHKKQNSSSSAATKHATFSSSIATEHATFYASAYGKYSVRTFASYQSSIKFLIWNQVARGIKQQHKATAHIQTIRRIVHTSVHTHIMRLFVFQTDCKPHERLFLNTTSVFPPRRPRRSRPSSKMVTSGI